MCQLFWGIFLVFIGISIVLNIPIFKFLLAGFLIYLGVRILMPSSRTSCNWSCYSCRNSCSFEKSDITDFYELRFGKSTVDLRSLASLTEQKTIRVEVQFAKATVMLPAGIPVRVKSDISFGEVIMPGNLKNPEYINLHGATEPLLTILIECAFGSVSVQE